MYRGGTLTGTRYNSPGGGTLTLVKKGQKKLSVTNVEEFFSQKFDMSEDEADIFNDDIIDLGGTHSDADGDEGAEEDAPAGGGVAEGGETHDEMDPTFGEINVKGISLPMAVPTSVSPPIFLLKTHKKSESVAHLQKKGRNKKGIKKTESKILRNQKRVLK